MGMSFNGSSQYRECGWSSSLTNRTLEARFRFSSWVTGTYWIVGSFRNSPIFGDKFAIALVVNTGVIPQVKATRGYHQLGFSTHTVDASTTATLNAWNYVRLNYNNIKMEIRLNGTYNSVTYTKNQSSLIDKFDIGRHPQGSGYWDGDLAELAAYNLSAHSYTLSDKLRNDQRGACRTTIGYGLIHYVRGCVASDPVDFVGARSWTGSTGGTDHPWVGNQRHHYFVPPSAEVTRRVGIGGCYADSASVKLAG